MGPQHLTLQRSERSPAVLVHDRWFLAALYGGVKGCLRKSVTTNFKEKHLAQLRILFVRGLANHRKRDGKTEERRNL